MPDLPPDPFETFDVLIHGLAVGGSTGGPFGERVARYARTPAGDRLVGEFVRDAAGVLVPAGVTAPAVPQTDAAGVPFDPRVPATGTLYVAPVELASYTERAWEEFTSRIPPAPQK